jgi:hypothetical protein
MDMSFSLLSTLLPLLLGPALFIMPNVGVTLPNQAPPDPVADAARFETVAKQLDLGGVLYGYVSVDGDLTAIGAYVKSFMDELRKIEPDVPPVDVPAILKVSGLDAISAVGFSSKSVQGGFRNKSYLYTPKGRRGLLRLLGGESKPFDVVKLAPAGSDFVFEQDLNLKVVYESIQEALVAGMGEQGALFKAMMDGAVKQPLPPPIPFTMEKVLADLDTQIAVIIDADPDKKISFTHPDAKGLHPPLMRGAILVDEFGWVADELVQMLEPMLAHPTERPPAKIVRDPNWVGVQLAIEPEQSAVMDVDILLELFGRTNPVLVHHRPSGKLILATGLEFAENLFIPKPNLADDPVFRKTMLDLPQKGTAIAYVSPALFSGLREVLESAMDVEDLGGVEDLFLNTFLKLFLPKNVRGEGRVTTNSKDGILTVSNSAHSHKANIISSVTVPLLMGVLSSLQPALPMMNELRVEAVHDHEGHIHDQLLELENDAEPGLKQSITPRGD